MNSPNTHFDAMLRETLLPLAAVMADFSVREIMINGSDQVWVEQAGHLRPLDMPWSNRRTLTAFRLLSSLSAQDGTPGTGGKLLDAAWAGWRAAAVLPPLAVGGPALCLRKHDAIEVTLGSYLADPGVGESAGPGSIPGPRDRAAEKGWTGVLRRWVREGRNLLVSGGTGSGKTTLLNTLLREIPAHERLVVIEDTRELNPAPPNRVQLQANPALGVSMRDLVRQALRLRPDRIVVGEVRGAEAFDLLQAMNTGHRGCFGTIHANGPRAALARLEQLVLQTGLDWPLGAIREQIGSAIGGIVQVTRRAGSRQIDQLIEVEGVIDGQYQIRTDP